MKHRIGRIVHIAPVFVYDFGKISAGCLVWYLFYDLQPGNEMEPILTTLEPVRGCS